MLEIFAGAVGLVLLHKASKDPPAMLLRAAGLVLVIGGVAVGLCISWYWFKYQAAGDFDHAAPHSQMEPSAMPGPHIMPEMQVDPAASGGR